MESRLFPLTVLSGDSGHFFSLFNVAPPPAKQTRTVKWCLSHVVFLTITSQSHFFFLLICQRAQSASRPAAGDSWHTQVALTHPCFFLLLLLLLRQHLYFASVLVQQSWLSYSWHLVRIRSLRLITLLVLCHVSVSWLRFGLAVQPNTLSLFFLCYLSFRLPEFIILWLGDTMVNLALVQGGHQPHQSLYHQPSFFGGPITQTISLYIPRNTEHTIMYKLSF